MKSELTYLLEQLKEYNGNKVITVSDLQRMIINSQNQETKDQEQIDESMQDWHR